MPATAAAAAAAAEGARAIRSCARAASVCWPGAHVRAHAAIGASAQPSSPSACSLAAGASSSVSCSIRPGSACGIDGPIGRCAALQRVRRGGRAAMSAHNCFQCGVPGGWFILPDTFFTSVNDVVSVSGHKCKLNHRATSRAESGEESCAAGPASSRQLLGRSAADVSEASVHRSRGPPPSRERCEKLL